MPAKWLHAARLGVGLAMGLMTASAGATSVHALMRVQTRVTDSCIVATTGLPGANEGSRATGPLWGASVRCTDQTSFVLSRGAAADHAVALDGRSTEWEGRVVANRGNVVTVTYN